MAKTSTISPYVVLKKSQPPKEETATVATATATASQSTTSDLLMELQRLREATNAALGRSEGWEVKKTLEHQGEIPVG